MSGYDYGNARIRGMKSRLLTKRETDALTEACTIQNLVSSLSQTAYQKSIESALAWTSGMECIQEALRSDLITTFGKLPRYFSGQPGEMVAILLRSYDIHNLKAIFRGVSTHATAAEILAILFPIGDLKEDILKELAASQTTRSIIDVLASQGSKFAHPLLKLRLIQPGAEVYEIEMTLDRWFFHETISTLKRIGSAGRLLLDAMELEVDLINLQTIMRFVHSPGERKYYRDLFHTDDLMPLLIGQGKIRCELLSEAGNQETINAAVRILESTPYEVPLKAGLNAYGKSALLSEIEKHLKRFQLEYYAKKIIKDPLGIGVPLGFLALKTNEVRNIRWIGQGIHLGLSPEAIRSELEYLL